MCVYVCLVMSDSLQPHRLQPTRLLCPWNSPRKNTRVSCRFPSQGIFPTQGSNPCLLHLLDWWADSLPLSLLGSLIFNVASVYHLKLQHKCTLSYLVNISLITSFGFPVAVPHLMFCSESNWLLSGVALTVMI